MKRLVGLTKKCLKSKDVLESLVCLCRGVVYSGVSSRSLRKFLGLLTAPYEEVLYDFTLKTLIDFKEVQFYKDVFVFTGKPNSGIGLLTLKALPKEGFCFCGSIRIERQNQSKESPAGKMTIFKLGSFKEKLMELYYQNGYIYYEVEVTSGTSQIVAFTSKQLEIDKWYFIEFYHLNSDLLNSLTLYVDSSITESKPGSTYPSRLTYDNNSIGCDVYSEYLGKQGKERIISNFCGEMSSLCFMSIDNEAKGIIHERLKHMWNTQGIVDFAMCKRVDPEILAKIFIYVNPRYARKLNQSKQKLYHMTGTKINIYSGIEQVHKGIKVIHTISLNENLINIGEIKALLPALYNMVDHNSPNSFMYYLSYKELVMQR